MAVDTHLAGELLSIISRLGSFTTEDDDVPVYRKGECCLEYLRDLQRIFRREFTNWDVHRCLGKWNVVQHDLLPLLLTYRDDGKLVLATMKLLVTLTLPLTDQDLATVPNTTELLEFQQNYKEAFARPEVIGTLVLLLKQPLQRLLTGSGSNTESSEEGRDTTKEDEQFVELVLALFKNLLAIADPPRKQVASGDYRAELTDRLIILFEQEKVFDVLVVLIQSLEEEIEIGGRRMRKRKREGWDLLLLELIYLLYRRETPHELFAALHAASDTAAAHTAGGDKENAGPASGNVPPKAARLTQLKQASRRAASLELRELVQQERSRARLQRAAVAGRHLRFGGTFAIEDPRHGVVRVVNQRFPGKHDPLHAAECDRQSSLMASAGDVKPRARGRRAKGAAVAGQQRLAASDAMRGSGSSGAEAKLVLKGFGERLLRTSLYNQLMRSVREEFPDEFADGGGLAGDEQQALGELQLKGRERPADYLHYFFVMGVFTGLHRRNLERARADPYAFDGEALDLRPIGETLGLRAFEDVSRQAWWYMLKQEWRPLCVVFSALPELLAVVQLMLQADRDPACQRIGRHLVANLFYRDHELTGLLVRLCHVYAPGRQGLAHLHELVHAIHLTLELVHTYTQQALLFVMPKRRRVRSESLTDEAAIVRDAFEAEQGEGDEQPPGDAEPEQARDRVCTYEAFVERFATQAVVRNYAYLLRFYLSNPPHVNHMVLAMLSNIASYVSPALLYQLSLLELFDRILHDPMVRRSPSDPRFRGLVPFITTLVGCFVHDVQAHPVLLAAVLSARTKTECLLLSTADRFPAAKPLQAPAAAVATPEPTPSPPLTPPAAPLAGPSRKRRRASDDDSDTVRAANEGHEEEEEDDVPLERPQKRQRVSPPPHGSAAQSAVTPKQPQEELTPITDLDDIFADPPDMGEEDEGEQPGSPSTPEEEKEQDHAEEISPSENKSEAVAQEDAEEMGRA